MRVPWNTKKDGSQDAAASGEGVQGLASALHGRLDSLAESVSGTVAGIRSDQERFRESATTSEDEAAAPLVDALQSRLDRIGADCREVAELLERYSRILLVEGGEARPAAAQAGAVEALPPSSQTRPVRVSEGVRLLATQMADAGADLDAIETRLRDEYGVADADAVVRTLFGS